MRRTRRADAVAQTEFRGAFEQDGAPVDGLALRRGPGADARGQRSAGEISVRLFGTDLLHPPLDAHHALELYPVELQRGKGVRRQLTALAAVIVGVPDNAARIDVFDQHHAGGGAAVFAHGGQGHGIGLGHLRVHGLLQPVLELFERIGLGVGLVQFGPAVVFAQIGK